MKKVLVVILALAFALPAFAQDDAKLKADLVAKEKMLWDAWFKKDTKPFEEHLAADVVAVDAMGSAAKLRSSRSSPPTTAR